MATSPVIPQFGQVLGRDRGADPDLPGQAGDIAFSAVTQYPEDPQSGWVGEHPERCDGRGDLGVGGLLRVRRDIGLRGSLHQHPLHTPSWVRRYQFMLAG